MPNSFWRHCASALTHPLTLASLLVLLLNDVVFKALWDGRWTTGKLSDLAWIIFAPPLLVFLLSYLTRRNAIAEKAVFLAAYLGLPLLYVAFNTFESLHNWILKGLLFFTGSDVGSPLDPTDSLVIPIGLAVALWVWKRKPAKSNSLRMRAYLAIAVIAGIATISSSPGEPSKSFLHVGTSPNQELVFEGLNRELHTSQDGGLSWRDPSTIRYSDVLIVRSEVEWGGDRVDTPRGTYQIDGTSILLLTAGGASREVYSTSYLETESNLWAQRYSARQFSKYGYIGRGATERLVVTEPINITYHESTGNVVASLGIQGVLVGDSNETWRRVAVGEFTPTDLSFFNKARLMFSTTFWLAALAFAFCFATLALVFGEMFTPFPYSWGREGEFHKIAALLIAVLGIILAVNGFPPFGGDAFPTLTQTDNDAVLAGIGFVLGAMALFILPPQRSQLRAYGVAVLFMLVSTTLPIVLWLSGGLTLIVAASASFILHVLTAFIFANHLVREAPLQDT